MSLVEIFDLIKLQLPQTKEGFGHEITKGEPFIVLEPLIKHKDKNVDVSSFSFCSNNSD